MHSSPATSEHKAQQTGHTDAVLVQHDYHHRAVIGNFGASFFWDWFCATDKGYWEEVLEEGYLRCAACSTRARC